MSRGCQSPGRGQQAQELAAGTLGLAPGPLPGTHVPTASPDWLSEHCWLCYANDGRWISHFPQPGFAQLCIYYPPLKIQSPQRRGTIHFYLFTSRVGADLSSNHPGLWSAKLPFVVRFPPPQIVYKTHIDICTPQHKLFPDSAKLVSLGDENVTAFADKPSDKPRVMSPAPSLHSHGREVNTLAAPSSRWLCINHLPPSTSDTAFQSLVLGHHQENTSHLLEIEGLNLCLLNYQ